MYARSSYSVSELNGVMAVRGQLKAAEGNPKRGPWALVGGR